MQKASSAQIYLADQRGITETDRQTCWCTFNYGTYIADGRKPFGALLTLNDELFMPGHHATYPCWQNSWAVVVPITGEVGYKDALGNSQTLDVGHVQVRYVPGGKSIELNNPYTDDRINFLYLEFAADEWGMASLNPLTYSFDFDGKPDTLIDIVTTEQPDALHNLPFSLHIGMFQGRGETIHQMKKPGSFFFAFVIAGAFELQGRLLHQRDGLALWNLQEADIEALSNNAVLLMMEITSN